MLNFLTTMEFSKEDVDKAMTEVTSVLKWGITILLGIAAMIFVYFAITKAISMAGASSEDERKKHVKGLIFIILGAFICGISAGFMPLLFEVFGDVIGG